MKMPPLNHLLLASATAIGLAAAAAVGGDNAPKDKKGPATTQSSETVNTICPLMEQDVDPAIFVIHEGKKIGFCCKDCIEPFQKDPAKYMKDLK